MKTSILDKRFLLYLFCTGLMSCGQLEQKRETSAPASFDKGDAVHVKSGDIKNISTADNANFREDATVPLNVNVFLDGIRQQIEEQKALGLVAANAISKFTIRVDGCQSGNFQRAEVTPAIKVEYDAADQVAFGGSESLIKLIEGDLGCKVRVDSITFSGQTGAALAYTDPNKATSKWNVGERILFRATDADSNQRDIYLKVTSQLPQVITKAESVQLDITTVDIDATGITMDDSSGGLYEANKVEFTDDSAISVSVAGQKMSVNAVGRAIFDFTLKCDDGMVQSNLLCGEDKLSDFKANLLLSNADGTLANGSAQLGLLKDNVSECLKYTVSSSYDASGGANGNPGQSLSVFQADTKGYLDPTDSTSADLSDGGAEVQIRGAQLGKQGSMKTGATAPGQFLASTDSAYVTPVAGTKVTDGGIRWEIQDRRKYKGGIQSIGDDNDLNTEKTVSESAALSITSEATYQDVKSGGNILGTKKVTFNVSSKTLDFEWKAADDFNISEKAGDSAEDGSFTGTLSGTTYKFPNGYIQNDEFEGEVLIELTFTDGTLGNNSDDKFKINLSSTSDGSSADNVFKAEYEYTGADPHATPPSGFSATFASSTHDILETANFTLAGSSSDWEITEAEAKKDPADTTVYTSGSEADGTLTMVYSAKLAIKDHKDYKDGKDVEIETQQDRESGDDGTAKDLSGMVLFVYALKADGSRGAQLFKFEDDDGDGSANATDNDGKLKNTESFLTTSESLEIKTNKAWRIHNAVMDSRSEKTDDVSGEITQISNYGTGKFIQEYEADGETVKTEIDIKDIVRTLKKTGSTVNSHQVTFKDSAGSKSWTFDAVANRLTGDGDSTAANQHKTSTAQAIGDVVKIDDKFDAKVLGYSANSYASLRYILLLGNSKTKKCKAWPLSVAKTKVP